MNKYPVILCYHGVTEDQSKTDELVSYMEDIKQQVTCCGIKAMSLFPPQSLMSGTRVEPAEIHRL
ncbi:hypothetical protein [Sinobaca sp. H24]|uniref:hypothetical protein n=1 Tax=Sinobaca sp. H24 TaxID=2923376 RepID=UPI00207A0B5E|nr:hypothetical protein [Sinobaca sp. H24]